MNNNKEQIITLWNCADSCQCSAIWNTLPVRGGGGGCNGGQEQTWLQDDRTVAAGVSFKPNSYFLIRAEMAAWIQFIVDAIYFAIPH
jgi:hypothetical protein